MSTADATLGYNIGAACQHPQREVRWRLQRNGVRFYQRQCLICYQPVGTMIKHSEVRGEVPAFDEVARDTYWRDRQSAFEDLKQARLRAYDDQRAERRREYQEYLQTDAWWWKRKAVLERDSWLCQARLDCCTAEATQAHHKTYEHIFDEPLFDLIAVCRACHERLHSNNNQETW